MDSAIRQNHGDPIESLIEEILKETGLSDLPQDEIIELKVKLYLVIMQKLGIEMINLLSDQDLREYYNKFGDDLASDHISESTMMEINLFFVQKIENFPAKINTILQGIKKEFLSHQ